jgi:hypothetical protein
MSIEIQNEALATYADDFATDLNNNMLSFFVFLFYNKKCF